MTFKEITIYTSRLESQKAFYCRKLGLRMTAANTSSFSVAIGTTILNFKFSKYATSYHLAINIPSNKDLEAYEWLKSKVALLEDEHKNTMIELPNWNATSMFFYDADMNIMELISRKNLVIHSNQLFSERNFLHISEIGMAVHTIEPVYKMLNQRMGLEIYDGDAKRFCAIGEETALFIVINKEEKKWFPTNGEPYSSNFEAIVELANKEQKAILFKSGFLDIYDPKLV